MYEPDMVDKMLKDKNLGYASVIRKPKSFSSSDFNKLDLTQVGNRKIICGIEGDDPAFTA